MGSDKILSITTLLEEIKNKSEYCLKCNEQTQALIYTISQDIKENFAINKNCDHENCFKSKREDLDDKAYKDTNSLEIIFLEKIQENAKLKTVNERLLRNSKKKDHKIKELSRAVSLQNQQSTKFGEVFTCKDKVGKYNVEIQKLKKQIDIETKKLHDERAKAARSKNSNKYLNSGQKKLPEVAKKGKKHSQAAKRSYEDMDEAIIEKTRMIIRLNEESNINDETFDEPENLDSEADEELSGGSFKDERRSDELFKESTNADFEISP